jgi:hypothetical protein
MTVQASPAEPLERPNHSKALCKASRSAARHANPVMLVTCRASAAGGRPARVWHADDRNRPRLSRRRRGLGPYRAPPSGSSPPCSAPGSARSRSGSEGPVLVVLDRDRLALGGMGQAHVQVYLYQVAASSRSVRHPAPRAPVLPGPRPGGPPGHLHPGPAGGGAGAAGPVAGHPRADLRHLRGAPGPARRQLPARLRAGPHRRRRGAAARPLTARTDTGKTSTVLRLLREHVNHEGRAWIYRAMRLRKKPVVTYSVSGGVVRVKGWGFTMSSPVKVHYHGRRITTVQADGRGSINLRFPVPRRAQPPYLRGPHRRRRQLRVVLRPLRATARGGREARATATGMRLHGRQRRHGRLRAPQILALAGITLMALSAVIGYGLGRSRGLETRCLAVSRDRGARGHRPTVTGGTARGEPMHQPEGRCSPSTAEETTMMHPFTTQELVAQRRAALQAEASQARLAGGLGSRARGDPERPRFAIAARSLLRQFRGMVARAS